jgi:hypothetical protein
MSLKLSLPANFSASGSASAGFQFSTGHHASRVRAKAQAPGFTYVSNGYTMNSNGYLANPTHSAQVAANNAGALTYAEAHRFGLSLGGRK